MVEIVYPTAENKATFICPMCRKAKTVDVSKVLQASTSAKVNSSCACGHSWTSFIDKRKYYRKVVNLPGAYRHIKDGKVLERGTMKVVDLSLGGIKIKPNFARNLQIDNRLEMKLQLDDAEQTIIRKNARVRNASGAYIGASFDKDVAYDLAIGFYLLGSHPT
jgi:hypothetical protein